MANEYHELINFIGPDLALQKLETFLGGDNCGISRSIEAQLESGDALCGAVNDLKRSETKLFMALRMCDTSLGAWFPEISSAVPNLFMTSSAHCVWDNRHYFIGGFGGKIHFLARPPMFGPDYQAVPGISEDDPYLLDLVRNGFGAAGGAALKAMRRRAVVPRKAIRILRETQAAYLSANPPPDEVFY